MEFLKKGQKKLRPKEELSKTEAMPQIAGKYPKKRSIFSISRKFFFLKYFSVKREDEEKKLEVENDELRRSIMIQRQNIQLAVRQNEELEVKIRDLEEELER